MSIEESLPDELKYIATSEKCRTYRNLRDSGYEWLGRVPMHWAISPLYARYWLELGKMLDAKQITGEHSTPYLRNVDVQWDQINTEDLPEMDIAPDEERRFVLRDGDLLVCEGGEVGRAAIWIGQLARCGYQKALHRLRPRSESEVTRFLYYSLAHAASTGVFLAQGNPNTIPHLTGEQLRVYRLPFPPANEQQVIAAFLDRETARIDALIAKKQRLIELLQEKQTALISHTIAFGLNRDVKMTETNHPCFQRMPAHWRLVRLRHISPHQTVGVVVNPSSYFEDTGVPILLGNNVGEGQILLDGVRFISEASNRELYKSMLRAGDIVVVRVGEPGIAAVVPKDLDRCNCASMMLVRQGPTFDSYWLCYAFNSRPVRSQVDMAKYGAAQKQFNISHAVNFWFAVPPKDEQLSIVHYLNEQLRQFEQLASHVHTAVDRLCEYRSALISAAVTGKIDVRGEVS